MRKTRSCLVEGQDDCQQLKPKGSHASFGNYCDSCNNSSYAFSLVWHFFFVLRVVFFHVIFFCVARYMYDARRRDFALSTSFVPELECFDGSEVTGKGNDSIPQKQIVL